MAKGVLRASPISVESIRGRLRYDPETGEIFRRMRGGGEKRIGGLRPTGYRALQIDGVMVYEHRLAWALSYGEWPSDDIDHINGDRSDNRLSNLRLATRSQNNINAGPPKDNTSGFRGVSANRGRWGAYINVDGKRHWLGTFDTQEEAAAAYAEAALKHFGEFARPS